MTTTNNTQELGADDLLEVEVVACELELGREEPRASHSIAPQSVAAKTDDRRYELLSSATLRAAHEYRVEDDAYFHPGGRILSIADATIDGWRPEPTYVMRRIRARTRRSWLVLGLVALVAPLLLLVALIGVGSSSSFHSWGGSSWSSAAAQANLRSARLHQADLTTSPASKEIRSRAIPTRDVRRLSSSPSIRTSRPRR